MRVRIIRPPTQAVIDGIRLSEFEVGAVYGLPTELATVMIVEGWAVPALETIEPKLPPVKFNIMVPRERRRRLYSDWRLRVDFGIAADRRRK